MVAGKIILLFVFITVNSMAQEFEREKDNCYPRFEIFDLCPQREPCCDNLEGYCLNDGAQGKCESGCMCQERAHKSPLIRNEYGECIESVEECEVNNPDSPFYTTPASL